MANMTELAFARQFLTALDARPIKLSSDHIADPKTYPAQGAYTIPKLSSQPLKRKREPAATAPGTEKATPTISVTLKNTKTPDSSVQLDSQPITSSIFDLKTAYSEKTRAPVEKIKLVFNKKPTTDSKTLKDILGDAAESTKEVEFTVMVMGGIPAGASPRIQPAESIQAAAPVAVGKSGTDVLGEEGFWNDLHDFLQQRIRDEGEAGRLTTLFRDAWQKG